MRILSFGEIIWDVYPDQSCIGGAPLNFAAHTVKSGAEAYLLSAVGEDALGREAMERLAHFGVRSDFVGIVSSHPTGQCLVSLNEAGVPSYEIVRNTAYDHIPLSDAAMSVSFDALAFGTLALRGKENRETLSRLLSQGRIQKIYCDLNLRAPFYDAETVKYCLSYAHILKVSEDELAYVGNTFLHCADAEYASIVSSLFSAYPQIELVLLTCGEKGAYAYVRDMENAVFCPSKQVNVVSTVGAGDSFGAAFLVEYLRGEPLLVCLEKATERSAYVVSHAEAIPI